MYRERKELSVLAISVKMLLRYFEYTVRKLTIYLMPQRVVHVIPEEDSISISESKEKPVSRDNVMEFPAIHAVTQLQAKGEGH